MTEAPDQVRLVHTGGAVVSVPARKVDGLLRCGFSRPEPAPANKPKVAARRAPRTSATTRAD